jgi:hypothetical protein
LKVYDFFPPNKWKRVNNNAVADRFKYGRKQKAVSAV